MSYTVGRGLSLYFVFISFGSEDRFYVPTAVVTRKAIKQYYYVGRLKNVVKINKRSLLISTFINCELNLKYEVVGLQNGTPRRGTRRRKKKHYNIVHKYENNDIR